MKVAAVLVAAGSGSRFGEATPKQFFSLAGRPVVRWAAEALAPHAALLQPVGDPAPSMPRSRASTTCRRWREVRRARPAFAPGWRRWCRLPRIWCWSTTPRGR